MESSATHCRNCQSPLDGQYCASCGQREGRGDLHFADAATEVLGDVFTWDSRIWRTLFSILFRPGFLSAEFNAGRRMRYMPPFRLYIVVSFLMFLVLSLEASDSVIISTESADNPPAAVALDSTTESKADPEPDGFTIKLSENGPPWVQTLEKRIEANARRVREDPSDYLETLAEYLPQIMFVMLPLFALLLKLIYFFSPFHYLQHLVFGLHYHTFVYLLYLISAGLERLSAHVDGLFALLLIIYLPLALRRCYFSSWPAAIGKSLLLLLSYGVALLLGLVTVAVAVLAII
ncbi:MAG: DUF3667 domain-containing protein [Congregibacter sp.]|nr:DUF3667 domain-containing protein [Congregibacter sp.]